MTYTAKEILNGPEPAFEIYKRFCALNHIERSPETLKLFMYGITVLFEELRKLRSDEAIIQLFDEIRAVCGGEKTVKDSPKLYKIFKKFFKMLLNNPKIPAQYFGSVLHGMLALITVIDHEPELVCGKFVKDAHEQRMKY